jgi:hypothetical protein
MYKECVKIKKEYNFYKMVHNYVWLRRVYRGPKRALPGAFSSSEVKYSIHRTTNNE